MTDHVPEELFEEEVYDHFYAENLEAIAADNARVIAQVAGLDGQADILDAPCGDGRVSVQLAQLGHRVTGIDRSPRFIARARERPGAEGVDFRVGDLRELDFDGAFDLVLNWFSSFGYLDHDGNRAVLRAFRRALRPGGRLVLEQRNTLLTRRTVEAGGGMTRRSSSTRATTCSAIASPSTVRAPSASASSCATAACAGSRSPSSCSTVPSSPTRCSRPASTMSRCSTSGASRSPIPTRACWQSPGCAPDTGTDHVSVPAGLCRAFAGAWRTAGHRERTMTP